MSCQLKTDEHRDRLLAYSAGRLRGEELAKFEQHMRACPDCAAMGKAQSGVWNLLDVWEPRPVSQDFNRRLWFDRLYLAVNDFLRPVFARPAFPLAAATLVIAAGFVLDHPGKSLRGNTTQASAHVSSGEANKLEFDQVETTLDDIEMLRQFDAKSDRGGLDDGGKDKPSKSM
jgi:hypothetical protein